MKELKWYTFFHILIIESTTFLHKCLFENIPTSITNLLCFSLTRSQNLRSVRKVRMMENTMYFKDSQTLLHRAVFLYNKLPAEIKGYHVKKFKKYASIYVTENFANNNVPKNLIQSKKNPSITISVLYINLIKAHVSHVNTF